MEFNEHQQRLLGKTALALRSNLNFVDIVQTVFIDLEADLRREQQEDARHCSQQSKTWMRR